MKNYTRQDVAAIKEAQGVLDEKASPRYPYYIVSILLLMVGLVGLGLGRQTITLSDLSQQRARDISDAVFQECRKNFGKDIYGEDGWQRMSGHCHNVADVALGEMYATGVSPVDEVMERAKELERKARGGKR